MRRTITPLLTLFALFFTLNTAQAQFFEDFESGSKTSYGGASVTLTTGDWFLDDALLGSLANDKYNGSQGVRFDRRDGKTGNMYMEFDHPDGAEEVSFYLAHYGDYAEEAALQVQYSTDGGSSWTDVGDEIPAPLELTQYTIPVEVSGNIRFKFIQSSGTDRMNIDDIRITDFITAEEEATIAVKVDGGNVSNGDGLTFTAIPTGASRTKTVTIANHGNQELTITSVGVQGAGYAVSPDLADSTLSFSESADVTLTFSPESEGVFQGQLVVESNAVNAGTYTLNLSGEGFSDGEVISIADARQVDFGTRVTIAGRVTVANEFGGPVHLQDNTGALPVYWGPLHTAVEHGDSVVVSGPLTEFNPINGPVGEFPLQIAEYEGDDNIVYEILDVEKKEIEPELITIAEMNAGNHEAQLVMIENVTVDFDGDFQGEKNYDISDGTGQSTIRVDGDANIVGVSAPGEPTTIIGVVDIFYGEYQLKPRSAEDLGAEEVTYPGEDISKDLTFEAVTWNIEWFGDAGNGPDDVTQQFANVKTVIETIDAEIYALQEVSNISLFNALVDSLEDYGGILADFTQTQKTAFLFKRSEIDSLASGKITQNMSSNYWAGGTNESFARFPLMFQFNAMVNNESREIYAFNIHAKAMDDASSYNQRLNASAELKQYLDQMHTDDNVLFLGDYNDKVVGSITSGMDSPYKNFVDDEEYTVITKSLQDRGLASQRLGSVIDNITITSELADEYFEGTERIENTNYIGSYLTTTSDHFPVWTRFEFGPTVSNETELNQPLEIKLSQNYPNPFNPSTVISYQLAENSEVSLKVFDMLGREVASLLNNARISAGSHEVTFDASHLSSGMYIYQLKTAKGQQLTRKMMLIK